MAQAVYALEAERRWVLTGTPIVCPLTDRSNCVPLTCRLHLKINTPRVGLHNYNSEQIIVI